jgi:hypothetical protein
VILLLLFVAVGVVCFVLKTSVLDADLWLHLKAGDWMVHHRAFPYVDPFSRTAAGRPWLAYSWLPEVALYLSYRLFGLTGIGFYGTTLTLLVAASVLWMAWRLSQRFWLSCLLAAAACYGFLFNTMPRPVFISMILMSVTLALLLLASRDQNPRYLYWLPLIFCLWANSHVQFIYGIAVVGLFAGTLVVQRAAERLGLLPSWCMPATLPTVTVLAVFAACIVATLIGPYSFRLYQEAYLYSKSKVIYTLVTELQALDFRSFRHYVQLLLTAVAFVAVGWNKKVDPFRLLLLMFSSLVAYRAIRESWFACIPAVACIAASAWRPAQAQVEERKPLPKLAFAFVSAIFVLLLWQRGLDFDRQALQAAVSRELPVRAADFIRQSKPPGPLYNTFRWGDFLIWYLPEYPVAIDGRSDLYGEQAVELFTKTAYGVSYKTDPYLNESGVVLMQRNLPLVKFLSQDPQYEKEYEDEIAVVFRRR